MEAHEGLLDQRVKLLNVFDTGSEGLWLMRMNGRIRYYNDDFYHQFDIVQEDADVEDWIRLIHPLDIETFRTQMHHHAMAKEERVVSEYRVQNRQGQYLWIEASGVMMVDEEGAFMVGCHRNISDRKLMQDYLYQTAYFDPVSGLMNRNKLRVDLLEERVDLEGQILQLAIQRSHLYSRQYGQSVEDEFVSAIHAFMLKQNLESYTFYRLKSGVYAVLMSMNMSVNALRALAMKMRVFFADFGSSSKIFVGDELAIGGVFICQTTSAEKTLEILDKTCDYAGRQCAGRVAIYHGEVQQHIERFFTIQESLKSAIESQQISIALQPICLAGSMRTVSYEALARWTHPDIGSVTPDEFIPLAEEQGLIHALGLSVLEQACQFLSMSDRQGQPAIKVNVNVSALQIMRHDFAKKAMQVLRRQGLPAERITLEITESVLLDADESIVKKLYRLRALGFQLSLDDFGSGYSSVYGLFNLPFNQIKIDKLIISEAQHNRSCQAFIRFLTDLGEVNGIDIVAEGLEHQHQIDQCATLNVSHLQGFAIEHPAAITQWQARFACDQLSK
ncbi:MULTISPECIES: EAL domain-containing protein [Vibrio]|uniref:EAL domain-containing protein n=1 Tax=Vibrio TaxID=662 RepID=UPI0001B957F9|nr:MULTISPECIES: EAL domain-containing protein [Vibrio]EEX34305.1 predicted signal transduction protein [Vibrio coralliilyticus ATCC BAA-450]NOI30431.1 EAL domain-containing protein [Vibrio coralliilyticus]NOI50019.1 EAL domain-containing protein [Vibrio coralliilyticus]